MLKIIAAALTITAISATPVAADLSKKFGRASSNQVKVGSSSLLPPPGYKSQWWVAPNNCEYSRSGRPGETVWFLIINSAQKDCARYIVERGFKDAY